MNSFKRASDFNAELVIGPIQVCGMLGAALFGCLGCQSYLYFVRFSDDHLALKATVSPSTIQFIVDLTDCSVRLGICSHVRPMFDLIPPDINTDFAA